MHSLHVGTGLEYKKHKGLAYMLLCAIKLLIVVSVYSGSSPEMGLYKKSGNNGHLHVVTGNYM